MPRSQDVEGIGFDSLCALQPGFHRVALNSLFDHCGFLEDTMIYISKLVSLFFFVSMLTSCSYVNDYLGQDDDWVGEELAEFVLKTQTGIDVDLTPGTPE